MYLCSTPFKCDFTKCDFLDFILCQLHFFQKKVSVKLAEVFSDFDLMQLKAEFSCSFSNIAQYPFGEETCLIVFFLKGIDNNLALLNLTKLTDLGPSQVGQFVIKEWVERRDEDQDENKIRKVDNCSGNRNHLFNVEVSASRFT